MSSWLALWLWEVENGLIACDARPGVDYTLKDLITLVCHMDGFAADGPKARALREVASALRCLGNGSAATDTGAVEGLAMKLVEAAQRIGISIDALADAVDRAPDHLARALVRTAKA